MCKLPKSLQIYMLHIYYVFFFYKKNFYKKMILKKTQNLEKMLRKSPASNASATVFGNTDIPRALKKIQNRVNFSILFEGCDVGYMY